MSVEQTVMQERSIRSAPPQGRAVAPPRGSAMMQLSASMNAADAAHGLARSSALLNASVRQGPVLQAKAMDGRRQLKTPNIPANPPVQCQLWEWDGTQWGTVGPSSSSAIGPAFSGLFAGQRYDDNHYEQSKDPTLWPFLSQGEKFVGQSAAEKQLQGKTPLAREVRVTAVKSTGLSRGSGLHEIVPTNLGPTVAKSGNGTIIGAQSGLRTSTGQQLFNITGGDVGAHTGFAPKQGSTGYTHTKGQQAAHDELRDTTKDMITGQLHPDETINELVNKHIEITPNGQQVLASAYLEDMEPNFHQGFGKVGPVVTGGVPDPQRLAVAQNAHRGREAVKKRGRTLKRTSGRGRSPSPPRTPIDAKGGGGGYIQNPILADEIEPMPFTHYTGANDFEYAANITAWMTQPQRF